LVVAATGPGSFVLDIEEEPVTKVPGSID